MPLPLTTPRLLLRKPNPSDLDAFIRIYGDPETLRHIGTESKWNADLVRRQRAARNRTLREYGFTIYTVELNDTAEIIGECGLWPGEDDTPEISCVLARPFWGQGYAMEATRAVMHHARTELRLPRIVVRFETANSASARIIADHAELGFTFAEEYVCEHTGQQMRRHVYTAEAAEAPAAGSAAGAGAAEVAAVEQHGAGLDRSTASRTVKRSAIAEAAPAPLRG